VPGAAVAVCPARIWDHDRPIGRPRERALALRGFRGRHRPVLGRLRGGEDADRFPGVVRHGRGHEPPALVIRGGEAGEEVRGAERGPLGCRHPGRIGDRAGGPGCDPMRGQERRAVRQDGVMHRFLRGLALLRLAPPWAGTIDPQRGEDAWLQGRALVLAIALGNPAGHR
jgi:hypothetical protein